MALALTAVFRRPRAAAASTEGADYVKNGLKVWYDGVDNAGAGQHDAAATTWADLSGNGNDAVAVAPGLGWTDNACTNNADGKQAGEAGLFRLGDAVAPIIAGRTFTLEMAFRPSFVKNRKTLFGSFDGLVGFNLEENDLGMFRAFYNNRPNLQTSVPLVKDEDVVISLVSTTNSAVVYKNGVPVYRYDGAIDAAETLAAIQNPVYYLGGERQREGFAYRGSVYSFRLYDRALASEEVNRNALLDRERLLARTTLWTADADGSWLDAAGWIDSLPGPTVPAFLTRGTASAQTVLAQGANMPTVGSASLANGTSSTKLTVAGGTSFRMKDASLAVGAGAEVEVAAGASLAVSAEGGAPSPLLSVADGGKLSVNGGTVTLSDAAYSIGVFGSEGRTGTLEIASGRLDATVTANSQHGVTVQACGLLKMTGGNLTLGRKGNYNNGSGYLVTDGGAADISGASVLTARKTGVRLGSGTFRMAGTSHVDFLTDSGNDGAVYVFALQPAAGAETVMTVEDAATINLDPLSDQLQFFIGTEVAGSRAVLNWNSSGTLKAMRTLAVGLVKGYGELNVTRGQVIGGYNGFRVAQNYGDPAAGACVTGVVNVIGGSVRNMTAKQSGAKTVHGLIIGSGACVNLANPGYFWGTLNLYEGGAVTNSSEYFGIGFGCAEGTLNQHGGNVVHNGNQNEFIIGAWGGKGAMVMEGGRAWSKSAVYVGGATTNNLYYKRYNLYTQCPVTNHCATGLLRVTNGRFDSANTLWVSQDGQGTIEIGPTGTVSANNVVLTNTPAALTGSADLAARLKFTFGAAGVGTLTVTNTLTIGQGVTMEVDATALNGRGATVPLILCGESEGEFSAINVEGKGAVRKMTVDGAFGYWYQHVPGTFLIVK